VAEIANNNSIYDLKVCISPHINIQQAVDQTIRWLREHPGDDNKAASLVTTEALAAAFPCQAAN